MLSFEAVLSLTILLMFMTVVGITLNAQKQDTIIYQEMLLNDIIESHYKKGDFDRLSQGDFTVIDEMKTTAEKMGYCLDINAEYDFSITNALETIPIKMTIPIIFSDTSITLDWEIGINTILDSLDVAGYDDFNILEAVEITDVINPNSPFECECNGDIVTTSRVLPTYMGQNVKLNFRLCNPE